ncbi:MAG: hypothetical protein V4682_00530 [Patescibacteria group bacterium]
MAEDIAIGCNLAAGLLVLVAFAVYNLKDAKISTGTWIILAFGDSLDLASYFEMTDEWWKSIVPAAFALGSILTFGIGCIRRRFSWPDGYDWFIVLLDVAIIGVWSWSETRGMPFSIGSYEFAPPAAANLALQATAVIAFIPMYRGLLTGREREHALPWVLWTSAFVLFCISSVSTFSTVEEVAYPVVGLLTHALVAAIAFAAIKPLRT